MNTGAVLTRSQIDPKKRKHGTKPKNNAAFWLKKLTANKRRDALVTRTLRSAKWRVLRLWEHDLAKRNLSRLLARVQKALS